MKLNITKRDIKFFILGIISLIIIQFICDWNHNIKDIKQGFKDGYNAGKQQ